MMTSSALRVGFWKDDHRGVMRNKIEKTAAVEIVPETGFGLLDGRPVRRRVPASAVADFGKQGCDAFANIGVEERLRHKGDHLAASSPHASAECDGEYRNRRDRRVAHHGAIPAVERPRSIPTGDYAAEIANHL